MSNRLNYMALPVCQAVESRGGGWLGGILRAARTARRKERFHLDDRLKDLMQDLGNAINESLSDSDRIAEAIGEIKKAGYDVFLVLEATIGFNKREEGEDGDGEETVEDSRPRLGSGESLSWTSQDQKFLRALKISLNDDEKRH